MVRPDHPLLLLSQITLAQLAAFPLITYPPGTHQRAQIEQQFHAQGIEFTILLSTHDADLVYHYVEQDLGIGIVPGVIMHSSHHNGLRILDASHLFADEEIGVLFNKQLYCRSGYLYADEITRLQVAALLDDIVARGARRMANLMLSNLRQCFGWAIELPVARKRPDKPFKERIVRW